MHTTKTDYGTMLHLKDNLILSFFETWLLTDVITQLHWMNVGKASTSKTYCGTICFKAGWALHRMSMSDKSSIIDESETFLFTIWLEELKGIYWEEHWEYHYEPLYCKLWDACLDDWMISKEAMITYTWRVLFQLEASSWLIDNFNGRWHTQPIKGQFLREYGRWMICSTSLGWIEQHHTWKHSQAWEQPRAVIVMDDPR